MYIQETKLKALELLEQFKYLTTTQLIKLGLASSQPSVARIMGRFFKSKKELVNKLTFPLHPKLGKLQNIYCLNKHGALFLAQYKEVDIEEINYVKGNTFLAKDYFHRVTQIDYHINLYLRSIEEDFNIDFFYNYFDKSGANNSKSKQRLEASTKVTYNDGSFFIPDGIYKTSRILDDGTIQSSLYVLEIHKGTDTKRAIETIEKNIKAIIDGSVSDKFNIKQAHKVIVVFDNENSKDLAVERLYETDYFKEFEEFFEFIYV